MSYAQFIGHENPPFKAEISARRIAEFAESIGETNPIYFDEEAAKKAGYPGIPAPLTFPFALTMDAQQSYQTLGAMGVDRIRVVHGEQGFTYVRPMVAGDVITGRQRVVDIYDKKGGALTFLVTDTAMTDAADKPVCNLRSVIVIRNIDQGGEPS